MEELENNSKFWEYLDDVTFQVEQTEIDILSDDYTEAANMFWAEFPGEPIVFMVWTNQQAGEFLVNNVYAGSLA